mgnify:CR=1 FL=1
MTNIELPPNIEVVAFGQEMYIQEHKQSLYG